MHANETLHNNITDIVPTEELDSPADKSPIPNNAADTGPTKLVN